LQTVRYEPGGRRQTEGILGERRKCGANRGKSHNPWGLFWDTAVIVMKIEGED